MELLYAIFIQELISYLDLGHLIQIFQLYFNYHQKLSALLLNKVIDMILTL